MLLEDRGFTPQLAQDVFIAPGAAIIGDVRLATGVSVWFNAVLRSDNQDAYIEVGANSNIQDCCVFHTDTGLPTIIGAGVTIGHAAVIHSATVGDNTVVGMHATVLDGAVVGRDCIIGAGALVPPGAQIADRSLVIGLPGRVVRELTDAEVEANKASAAIYTARAQRYMRHIK